MGQHEALAKRIDQLLATDVSAHPYAAIVEAQTGTITLATAIYGVGRPQVEMLLDAAKRANTERHGLISQHYRQVVWPVVQGVLRAMKADVESGVLGSIARRGAGEVLIDMLGLAKEALSQDNDGAKNVAAVLAAASYEDTIRKMGEAFASVQGRPNLVDVVNALKSADVLQGASVSTAHGFLKFRNDALHADWTKLKPDVIASCISFVERLLLQHFS